MSKTDETLFQQRIVNGQLDLTRAATALQRLQDSINSMPSKLCRILDLPDESTFAQGVEALNKKPTCLCAECRPPVKVDDAEQIIALFIKGPVTRSGATSLDYYFPTLAKAKAAQKGIRQVLQSRVETSIRIDLSVDKDEPLNVFCEDKLSDAKKLRQKLVQRCAE